LNTSQLKQFAQKARRQLIELVSMKLSLVLNPESAARRENQRAVKELEKEISQTSEDQVIEKVAYIWFNRFCALRFMDVNRYNAIGVVSPSEGFSQPEILMEAKQGHIDAELRIDKSQVFGLLNETIPSPEPQQEAYRMLLVAVCNDYNSIMPFLFEKIADYTELLMPDDLLSDNSILTVTRGALSEEACADVEVIGWLYQFYISEKKDEVFAGLKKNKKVTPENIPAATQLFTPNWIVRYLVENSLGRLWMLNNPGSKLIDRMEYYIKPEQEETDFLVIKSPEEIKICDPACGSGHMLVYAFEILYAIYEEEGYDAPNIPQLILENNLYGIEIDERAGELAAFALCMKAREKYRRFFKKEIQPNICVLENVTFEDHEVKSYLDAVNPDLFTTDFSTLLYQFQEADNFGSLIRPELTNISDVLRLIDEEKVADDIFLQGIHKRVLKVLKQAEYLNPKYHVVIANPPYMGGKGMNGRLGKWAKDNYPNSKSDLFAMFIERNLNIVVQQGMVGMITMQSWMFLSSFEKFRKSLLDKNIILSMLHIGARGFDSIGGEVVQTTAFILKQQNRKGYNGIYISLVDGKNENEKQKELKLNCHDGRLRFAANNKEFGQIPGSPILYSLPKKIISAFIKYETLGDISKPLKGFDTGGDGEQYIKLWHEVTFEKTKIKSPENGIWVETNKGGAFRKWYGNREYVTLFGKKGELLYLKKGANIRNKASYFKEGLTYSVISSADIAFRWSSPEAIFYQHGATCIIESQKKRDYLLGLLNSKVSALILNKICPTLSYTVNDVAKLPIEIKTNNTTIVNSLIEMAKTDWDSFETSWGFTLTPLLKSDFYKPTLRISYNKLKSYRDDLILMMKRLEEDNNFTFIEIYGLQDEIKPIIPFSKITLNCNPKYRYPDTSRRIYSENEHEKLLLSDTIKEFVSYSVGCMFGRYSLDKPGLVLVNQGETVQHYLSSIPEPTFKPDDDNVIPIMDVDWFPDDIAERFKRFLKVTFGEEHYTENLEFIEKAIGKDIRKFFLKDFYAYHVKMYKTRPIYWMFSSPKGSFNALIYMHRYRPDTVSIVLNDYLREFRTKLSARRDNLERLNVSASASQGEKTKALKEIENIKKVLEEVNEYERDILYPLALKQVEIDLDDGVKVNYPKFGKALKKIPGLS